MLRLHCHNDAMVGCGGNAVAMPWKAKAKGRMNIQQAERSALLGQLALQHDMGVDEVLLDGAGHGPVISMRDLAGDGSRPKAQPSPSGASPSSGATSGGAPSRSSPSQSAPSRPVAGSGGSAGSPGPSSNAPPQSGQSPQAGDAQQGEVIDRGSADGAGVSGTSSTDAPPPGQSQAGRTATSGAVTAAAAAAAEAAAAVAAITEIPALRNALEKAAPPSLLRTLTRLRAMQKTSRGFRWLAPPVKCSPRCWTRWG